jgi:WW domain-containing oxidoreductase
MQLFKNTLTAESIGSGINLQDKTVLIAGVNSGIGFETARILALRGGKILMVARTLEKAKEACRKVAGDTIPLVCELSDVKSSQNLIQSITEPIDVFIANAGVMAIPEKKLLNGIEAHMMVNHMSHFMLVNGLIENFTAEARIIVVSSAAHSFFRRKNFQFDNLSYDFPYSAWSAYGLSKLANILFTKELAKRLKPNQSVVCLHPGIIDSNLWRNVPEDKEKYKTKGVEFGAASSVFLCNSSKELNGAYLSGGKVTSPSKYAQGESLGKQLWELSETFLK